MPPTDTEKEKKVVEEIRDLTSELNDLNREVLDTIGDQNKLFSKQVDKTNALNQIAEKLHQNRKGSVDALQMMIAQQKSSLDVIQQQKTLYDQALQPVQGIRDKFDQTKGFMMALTTGTGLLIAGLLAIVTVLGLMVKRFVELDNNIRAIRDQTGFTGETMRALSEEAERLNVEMRRYGIELEAAREIVVGTVQEYGSMVFLTDHLLDNVTAIHKITGLTVSESAKLLKVVQNLTGLQEERASQVTHEVKEMARLRGVMPQEVFRDIADNADRLVASSEKAVLNYAKAAINARQLGLTLGDALGIQEKLLDFQSSIEAAQNASILIGRFINLEQARFLALTGDLDGMLKSVVNQMGSFEEIQKLNIIQQQALAEGMGLTLGQLQNVIRAEERRLILGNDQLSTQEKIAQTSFREALESEDFMTDLESITQQLGALVINLLDVLKPGMELMVPLLKVINFALSGLVDLIGWFSDKANGLVEILTVAGAAAAAFFLISNPVGWVVAIVGAIAIVAKHWEGLWDYLKGWATAIWDVISAPFKGLINFITHVFQGDFEGALDALLGSVKQWAEGIYNLIVMPFKGAWDFLFGNTIWSAENIKEVFDPIAATVEPVLNPLQESPETSAVVQATRAEIRDGARRGTTLGDVVNELKSLKEEFKRNKDLYIDGKRVSDTLVKVQPTYGQ